MSQTLDILQKQHRALADYEAARERKRGARTSVEQAQVRAVVVAQRLAWIAAGGSEADFVLAPLLGEKPAAEPAAKLEPDEPAPTERPKRRER